MRNNVMCRQKGWFMTFNFINSRFCNDAIEGFGQSSTCSIGFLDITQSMFSQFGKISNPADLEIYFKLELAIELY